MQVSVHKNQLPELSLGRARSSRLRSALPTRRRQQPPWRLIGAVAVPIVVLGVVAYVGRRHVFKGVALFAKAVEEVADVVEDAAEDLAEAAQARAEQDHSTE